MGALYKDKHVGGEAKYSCYSFHAVKNMPIGDGGMLTTNSEEVAVKAKQLRWFGIDKSTYARAKEQLYGWEYNIVDVGYKGHMWDVQAAIGRAQLKYVDEDNKIRESLVNRYRKNLQYNYQIRPVDLPSSWAKSSNHLFVVRFENKESRHAAMERLNEADIQYGFHYKPNYSYSPYSDFPIIGTLNMEKFYETALTLPLHLDLKESDVDLICDLLS
jgi:perosamine synthetase